MVAEEIPEKLKEDESKAEEDKDKPSDKTEDDTSKKAEDDANKNAEDESSYDYVLNYDKTRYNSTKIKKNMFHFLMDQSTN